MGRWGGKRGGVTALGADCRSWQLHGQAGVHRVDRAKVGITANLGPFGHGPPVVSQ
jgi:hypothetical protein